MTGSSLDELKLSKYSRTYVHMKGHVAGVELRARQPSQLTFVVHVILSVELAR